MLLALGLIGSLALAAVIVVRWLNRRVDWLGRIAPFPRISVGISLALALCFGIPLAVEAWVEHQLEGAASQIAGGPVEVSCQSFGQAFVDPGQGHVHSAINRGTTPTVFIATFYAAPAEGGLLIPAEPGDC